jgi:hypothetical protein
MSPPGESPVEHTHESRSVRNSTLGLANSLISPYRECVGRGNSAPARNRTIRICADILLPNQLQHLPPEFLGLRAVRTSSCAAVLQSLGSFVAISLPQPLRLPIAQLQHLRCVYQPQRLPLHSPQNLGSSKFPCSHRRPLQPDLLRRSQEGTFLMGG